MIPYYNPHLYLSTVIKSIFIRYPEKKIQEYFKKYTGKKYILLTDSCRSALKLGYECIKVKGEVITSPLTCKVAILPITETGNKPKYIDIKKETLVMNENMIEDAISDSTIAIQAIHLGGTPCEMNVIRKIATSNNIVLIEDCAQGFGATLKGQNIGSWGDISCFSMIKNMYGIGGGVFATDDYTFFARARLILEKSNRSKYIASIYRVFLGIIETKRRYVLFEKLYHMLKKNIRSKNSSSIYIQRINIIELKINYLQLLKSTVINNKRVEVAKEILACIRKKLSLENYSKDINVSYSFTKLNLFSYNFDINKIKLMNLEGVEAKHLEHKYQVFYQDKLSHDSKLFNYHTVHDKLISLPIDEFRNDEICKILLRVIRNG